MVFAGKKTSCMMTNGGVRWKKKLYGDYNAWTVRAAEKKSENLLRYHEERLEYL